MFSWDIESTGVDVFNDRVVTCSGVYLDADDTILAEYEWLVNPKVEIPEGAANVHGITTAMAQEGGMEPAQGIDEIARVIAYFLDNGVPVVAYNGSYDFSLLEYEIKRHTDNNSLADYCYGGVIPKLIIDPFVIDKTKDKWRKGKRTLTAVASHYGFSFDNAHTSAADCMAAALVLRSLEDKYPSVFNVTYDVLYDNQVAWYKEFQESFAQYLGSQGKDANGVNTQWPIRLA